MNNTPLVSILVPVYGVEQYIERCARSLFEQDYPNLEFVFVDDCTPDNSIGVLKDIVKDYPLINDKVKIIAHEANKGSFLTRQTALAEASGEWVLYVDSDDFLPQSAVTIQVNASKKTGADVVMGRLALYQAGKFETLTSQHGTNNYEHICLMLRKETGLGIASRLIKKELLVENNSIPYDSIGNLTFGEDYVITAISYYYSAKIAWIDDVVYYYEKGNNTSSSTRYSLKTVSNLVRSREIVYDFYKSVPDSERYLPSARIGLGKAKIWILTQTNFATDVDLKNLLKNGKGGTFNQKVVLLLINLGWYNTAKLTDRILNRLKIK